jgi:hypothetical protein
MPLISLRSTPRSQIVFLLQPFGRNLKRLGNSLLNFAADFNSTPSVGHCFSPY